MVNGIIVRSIALIVAIVIFAGTWITDGKADLSFFRYVSIAAFLAIGAMALWDHVLWKLPVVQNLPKVPRDISGTWETELASFWSDPATGKQPDSKTVYTVIRQTSSSVNIKLLSDESRSASSLARMIEENGSWLLHYVYTNEPGLRVRERSRIHHGSAIFHIVGQPVIRITGTYWTDRESKGELRLKRRVKRRADDASQASELFDS